MVPLREKKASLTHQASQDLQARKRHDFDYIIIYREWNASSKCLTYLVLNSPAGGSVVRSQCPCRPAFNLSGCLTGRSSLDNVLLSDCHITILDIAAARNVCRARCQHSQICGYVLCSLLEAPHPATIQPLLRARGPHASNMPWNERREKPVPRCGHWRSNSLQYARSPFSGNVAIVAEVELYWQARAW